MTVIYDRIYFQLEKLLFTHQKGVFMSDELNNVQPEAENIDKSVIYPQPDVRKDGDIAK